MRSLEAGSSFPGTVDAGCLTRTGEGSLESTQEIKYGLTAYSLAVHFNKVRYQNSGVNPSGCPPTKWHSLWCSSLAVTEKDTSLLYLQYYLG